ncbi:MAG: molecular chaperone DnaJ [Sulfurimonas sp. RIFOXYD12_FULL_33_39]|uniref:J domain-containing protein n=1 Tax=unclassified Sulfurimonas TaxID=2623549 RepID=UPI0008BDC98B|nr:MULTISPECIES: J domain-containing protein [unclassified Sulfurimonas]OHE06836.1 MAG: molecular chaperone DnaJ [Sulfurimonas sp. RIFCSPLOWO2_12_FULL_34_6]OHE09727.1 MAG: molecular chaperone DnaJ [Sulfurimonas sp. RIFOXYD12_FULL_33_39]OHE13765.1 MAG: molecular chaperone DnaJ [Sulfurimonas sp. RIFOXYD2_FULL_34_21]DAB28689.1 MAG TPA: molecular chaperone DnaJ [Sulfurimonas sp. UBA10385]
MEIVLRNNLILITTDFDTLNTQWMRSFLNNHSRGMLFLSKAVLVFRNETLKEAREEFIKELSQYHAARHDFSHEFFLRSMLKFGNQPIRVELNKSEEPQVVEVNLYAYDSDTVLITLDYPNSWVMSYLRSQLEVYVEKGTDISLVIDVSDYKAKERLEKALNKRHVLHYQINYNYNNRFISKLYSDFANFSFGNLCKDEEDEQKNHFYAILQCPIGASQDVLRNSYKRLAKAYHPDKILKEAPHMIKHYTQKFQLLQEAYSALRVI